MRIIFCFYTVKIKCCVRDGCGGGEMIKKRLRVSVRRSEYDSNDYLISSLGLLTFFFKSVTYRPTLRKYRGGPVKKITLYIDKIGT